MEATASIEDDESIEASSLAVDPQSDGDFEEDADGSAPPATTTRGRRLSQWRNSFRNSFSNTSEASSVSLNTTVMEAAPPNYEELMAMPPHVMSIAFYREEEENKEGKEQELGYTLLGIGSVEVDDPTTGDIRVGKLLEENKWDALSIPIKTGDILVSLNGEPFNGKTIEDALGMLRSACGLVTVYIRKKETEKEKPQRGEAEPIISQAIFVGSLGHCCLPYEMKLSNTDESASNAEDDASKNSNNGFVLKVESLRGDWLENSSLDAKQVVLQINDRPAYAMEASEALKYISSQQATAAADIPGTDVVSIKTLTMATARSSFLSSARRSAVAVGGGAMVGVGSVLMVTPLHPVGHAMAIGGVGLLGTEFEAPRKAAARAGSSIRSLRSSFTQRMTERRQRRQEQSDQTSSPDGDDVDTEEQKTPKSPAM